MQNDQDIRIAINHLKSVDPKLAIIIDNTNIFSEKIDNYFSYFERITLIIIGQQLSGTAANTISNRLRYLLGKNTINHKDILNTPYSEILRCGLSKSKANYIIGIANLLGKDPEFFEKISFLPDSEKINALLQIKGIGIWSASIFVMSAYQSQNIFPLGDATLTKAITKIYEFDPNGNTKKLEKVLNKWTPYRSVASKLLWNWVDQGEFLK